MVFRSEYSNGKGRCIDGLKRSKGVSGWEMTKRKHKNKGEKWQSCLEDTVKGGGGGLIRSGGGGLEGAEPCGKAAPVWKAEPLSSDLSKIIKKTRQYRCEWLRLKVEACLKKSSWKPK